MEGNTMQVKGETFLIDIISKENHSWQGTLTWINTNKRVPFRSALELIKIIDSALGADTHA